MMEPHSQLYPLPVPAAGGKELPFLKVFVMFSSSPLRTLRGEHVAFAPAVDDVVLSASHQQRNSGKRAGKARATTSKEQTREDAGKRWNGLCCLL